jgi:hypothetical protein
VPLPALPDTNVRVLRASDVALLAASGTSATDFTALDEANRVGLLRTLAVTHRDPFANDHEQPIAASGGGYLMELGGSDRGMTVVHVAIESRTAQHSAWPTSPAGFMVVVVPPGAVPPSPLVTEIRVADRSVRFVIAPDITHATRAIALYRARTAADAEDVRRMKPVAEVTIPQMAGDEPTVVLDTGLFDEVDYFYRAVAIGEDGIRSAPTGAMRATPISHAPPPAVAVDAIERDPGQPALRRVHLVIPRRDYPIFLFRRRQFGAGWETPSGTGVGPNGRLDLVSLSSTPDSGGYRVLVEDVVPVADTPWSYIARIEDPRGRVTMGTPVMETV